MNSSRRVNVVASIVLVGGNGLRRRDAQRDRSAFASSRTRSRLSISARPKALRRMSLGYTGLLADIYWTRAVQYFGYQHHQQFHRLPFARAAAGTNGRTRSSAASALSVRSDLSSARTAEWRRNARRGTETAPIRHCRTIPDKWSLYYNLGFLYYTEFKDYGKAAEAFAAGARLPVTHQFMPVLGRAHGAACRRVRYGAHALVHGIRNARKTQTSGKTPCSTWLRCGWMKM